MRMRMMRMISLRPRADRRAVERKKLPHAENQSKRNRHEHEDEPLGSHRFAMLRQKPVERRRTDTERCEDAKDAPSNSGSSGAITSEDDTYTNSDHDEVPDEWEKQRKGIRARSKSEQRARSRDGEHGATDQRAKRQLFHSGNLRGSVKIVVFAEPVEDRALMPAG